MDQDGKYKRYQMKKIIILISAVFVCFAICADAATRTALVIGNGAYKMSALRNPVNDAHLMRDVLKKCDFSVTLVTDANRKQMRKEIRKFGEKIKKGGTGLFYYAGHGIQVKGENYLVPVQSEVYSEAEVADECLLVSSVLRQMESAGNDLNIIILDACRNNPFERSFRSNKIGLAKMETPAGSLLGYATSPGSVAADGIGGNGLYTSILAKNILNPGMKIEEVFKQTRIAVVEESKTHGQKQVPWESSSLMGDFYFNLSDLKSGQSSTSAVTSGVLKKEQKKLEQAKRELEKIKSEIAEHQKLKRERKQVEAEKQKLLQNNSVKLASVSSADKESGIIARDDQYSKYKNGIVYDKETGLEWVAGPDKYMGGNAAQKWAKNLNLDGGGWRMPSGYELKGLYESGAGARNMTSLLDTSAWWVWSSRFGGFSFKYGNYSNLGGDGLGNSSGTDCRAFAVRSKKAKSNLLRNNFDYSEPN